MGTISRHNFVRHLQSVGEDDVRVHRRHIQMVNHRALLPVGHVAQILQLHKGQCSKPAKDFELYPS